MSFLRRFGKATAGILALAIGPMVGKDDLVSALGYIENAGAPSAVVPDYVGQKLFDTSNSIWYRSYGLAAGEWAAMGVGGLSGAELAVLDGALSTNAVANKAAIIDSTGILALSNNKMAVEAGVGITAGVGTVYKSSVSKVGGIIRTSILIDLTGLTCSATDLDIIGVNDTGVAHLGQITAARNGTILTGRMTCLEVPNGTDDIDLYSAVEGTGVEDVLVTSLTETALITSGAAWTNGLTRSFGAIPAANEFLYLTAGEAAGSAPYTAGKFLIELEGYDA